MQIENIINHHIEHRKVERDEDPKRFNKKVTIAEKAVRKPAEREGSSYSGNTYEEPEYTNLKSLGKFFYQNFFRYFTWFVIF